MANDIDVMRKSYYMVDDVGIHITKKVLWRMMCEFTLGKKFYHMADDGSYIVDIYIII